MALSRYKRLDTYTTEELRRTYYDLAPKSRVRLLKRLATNGEMNEEVKDLAVRDKNAAVRQWAARSFDLSVEQTQLLKADPDEFVRACLLENPEIVSWFDTETDWLARFKEATHTERLAMMRNPQLHAKFIEMVFNPEDTELGVSAETRAQFVFAILSNRRAIEADLFSYDEWLERGGDAHGHWDVTTGQKKHFAALLGVGFQMAPGFLRALPCVQARLGRWRD